MFSYRYILLIVAIALAGCSEFQQAVEDAQKETPPPPRDNYIILLDLSDRILVNNQQQVSKDIFVIESIYKAFKAKLDAKDPTRLYYTVSDKLKVMIAPQKSTLKEIYDMAGHLRIALASAQPEQKAHLITEAEKQFSTLLPELYKKAVISNNSSDYTGADIWRYFNEDLQGDLDKDARNTLFIITDGYMDFENPDSRLSKQNRFTSCSQIINTLKKTPDWSTRFAQDDYGLLPVNKKFSNLRVVLLEVNPKDDWVGEYPMLTSIWSKWFHEMGIDSCSFIKDDNVQELNEAIEKTMSVRLPGNHSTIAWTAVTDIDSMLAMTNSAMLAAAKKKDSLELNKATATPDIRKKTTKNPPVKPSVKPKEQVSFGPAY